WVYANGDIVGNPLLAHKASHQGKVAAEVVEGIAEAELDPRSIPSLAYTDPEEAWTGLTDTEARAQRIEDQTAVIRWSESGRRRAEGSRSRSRVAADARPARRSA